MKYVAMVIALAVSGCAALPSMKYCDQVEYKREGSKIQIKAECTAPVGGSMPGL